MKILLVRSCSCGLFCNCFLSLMTVFIPHQWSRNRVGWGHGSQIPYIWGSCLYWLPQLQLWLQGSRTLNCQMVSLNCRGVWDESICLLVTIAMKIIIGLILSVHKLQEAKLYFALYVFESWDKEIKKAPVPGRKYPNPRMTRSECIVVIWGTFFYQYGLSDFWPRVCEWPEPPGTVGQVPSLEMTTSKKKSWGGDWIQFCNCTCNFHSSYQRQ